MNELQNNGSNKCKQQADAYKTLINSNNKQDQAWTSKQYFTKLQHKLNKGDVLPRNEINERFNNLRPKKKSKYKAGAKRIKTLLANTDKLIGHALQQTNGMVIWKTIARMIAVGATRVQHVSAKIAKYVMSTYRAKYTSTKLQPTINEHNKQQCYQWSK